jgi:hypothetical protein
VDRVEKAWIAYRILFGELKLERPRNRWEDNVNIDPREKL